MFGAVLRIVFPDVGEYGGLLSALFPKAVAFFAPLGICFHKSRRHNPLVWISTPEIRRFSILLAFISMDGAYVALLWGSFPRLVQTLRSGFLLFPYCLQVFPASVQWPGRAGQFAAPLGFLGLIYIRRRHGLIGFADLSGGCRSLHFTLFFEDRRNGVVLSWVP